MYELKKLYLIFFFGVLAFSASTSAQNYGGELDGDWASIEEEKEFRLGFFADNSRASVAPQSDGSIEVTNTESGDSIQVEPGEIGDASDIFGTSITDNLFANCGYVQREHSKFVEDKINFYYNEAGGGSTGTMERSLEDKIKTCEAHRADTRNKEINFNSRGHYTLYFRPGTSVDNSEESYTLQIGSREQDIVFTEQVGGIGHIGIRPNIGDEFIPDWSTGEEIRIREGIYAQLGEGKYDDQSDRYFSIKLYKGSKEGDIVQGDLNYVSRVFQDLDRQPEQFVINGRNTYLWIDDSGDLMRDDKSIADINDWCNQGAQPIETIGIASIVIDVNCYETGGYGYERVSEIKLWKIPSDKRNEAKLPQASLSFGSDNYEVGQSIGLELDIESSGDYTLELSGAGVDKERKISSSEEIELEPSREGNVEAKLSVDSDDWLLVDDSDLVSEASVSVAETLPEASISYDLPYTTASLVEGQETKVKFNFKESGNYKISSELNGDELVGKEIETEAGETHTEDIRVSEPGSINSKVVAPSGFWVFGSDKTVASNDLEVESADNVINAETGEIHNISIYEENDLVNYDGRTFRAHNRYRVASDDNPPTGVRFVWNNGETTLLKPNEQHSGIHLCEFGGLSEGDYALIVTGEVENPAAVCRQESDNLEVDRSAEFGEIVSLEQNQIADFEGIEVTLHSIYEYGISMSGRSYTLHELESHSSTDNYIVTCQTRSEKSTAELTMVRERMNPYNICNVDVKKERNATPEYDMKEYQLGEKIELSEGEGLKFGESTAYIDEIDEIESDFIRVQGYKERTDKPTKDLYTAQENSSTVEWFAEGEMLIGTCELTQEKVEIIIEERNQVSETAEWPEDWCYGESPDANEGSNNQGTIEGNNSRDDRKVDLNISKEEYETGDTVNVDASVTESIAENGYSLSFVGPSEYSEDFDSVQGVASFTPEEQGDYTVKIIPREGLISRIGSSLVGNQEDSLKTVKFTVINPKSPKWISYCQEQEYDTESVSQKVTCIEQEIVPQYFQETTGEKPEIAQSLCNNLLGYNYNQENNRCAES